MVHGSSQAWESKMGLYFCSETLVWLMGNSGMEQTETEMSAGQRVSEPGIIFLIIPYYVR